MTKPLSVPKPLFGASPFRLALGCGGGNARVADILEPASGTVVLLAIDFPAWNVVSFVATISGASLTPASGGSSVARIASPDPVTVDFSPLRNFNVSLAFAKLLPDTYDKIAVNFADPHLIVLDNTQKPPSPVEVPATMAPLSVTSELPSALTVSAPGASALLLHFNPLQSLQTDSNGQLTGWVVLVVTAEAGAGSLESRYGNLKGLKGIVQAVSETNVNPFFTGSLTLPRSCASDILFTINITDTTKFPGAGGQGDLVAGKTFVEVDAFLDTGDNIIT